MKINYTIIEEINRRSLVGDQSNSQLSCFYLIQHGVERFLNGETLSNDYMNFLIQVGVLEQEAQDEKKKIVEPFNFTGNGPQGN